MREKLFLVYFNISLVCVLLVGMELVGQLVYFVWKGYPLFESGKHEVATPHQQLFERHPYLVARLRSSVTVQQGDKVVSTTAAHTRWTGANLDDTGAIRIAVVGGSTTFGSGVSDADSWPARLQALLGPGFAVINYGVPGYSTAEGVIQLALLVPEARPDVVVLYEGWNDIRNYHEPDLGPDYYSHGMRQYLNLRVEQPPPSAFARLAGISAVGRLVSVLARKIPSRAGPEPPGASPSRSSTEEWTQGVEVFDSPDPFVDSIYLRNLRTLRLLSGQLGAYVLFVPQVVDYARYRGGRGSHVWTPHIEDDAMPGLLGRFNRIMDSVCLPGDHGCEVLNEVNSHTWPTNDFLDEGHFLRAGNDTFASLVAARIVALVNRRSIRSRAGPRTGLRLDSPPPLPRH